MKSPTNTAARPPIEHLMLAMLGDTIEASEARGQRELVASEVLPVDCQSDDALVALGFTFGAPVDGDPIFRAATLPPGWTRQSSDHAMWSHIVDERGFPRVAVFYKAAFYDRSAHMDLVDVGRHLAGEAFYGDAPIPWALLTPDEVAAARAALQQHAVSGYRTDAQRERARALLGGAP